MKTYGHRLAAVAVAAARLVAAITPEEMISANRYSAAQPNPTGVSAAVEDDPAARD